MAEDIRGIEFTCYVPAGIKSVDEAAEHLKPLFSEEAKVTITSMEYDYVGEYGQTAQQPIRLEVQGRSWVTLGA